MKTAKPRVPQNLATTLSTAFISLSVGALLLAGGLQLLSHIRTQQTAISKNLELIAQQAAGTVRAFVQVQFGVLETAIRVTDPGWGFPARKKVVLESVLSLLPAVRQLALLDAQDREVVRYSRMSMEASGRTADWLDKDAMARIRQGQRYFSPIFIDPQSSEPMAFIAVRVADVFGNYQGTLAGEVNLKFMWDMVRGLKVGRKGVAYVVDRQGNLIAFPDPSRVLKGENVKTVGMFGDFIKSVASPLPTPVRMYRGIMGAVVAGTYVCLQAPDWAVVTELPWTEAYRGVIGDVIASLAIIAAIAVIAGLRGAYLARRLSIPLVGLMETATRIAGGERKLQVEVNGPLEVAGMAAAFNSMTDQLRQTLEGLERGVAERTRQLQEALDFQKEIVTVSSTGIAVYDSTGQCILANEALARMLGASIDQVLALNYHNIGSWKESGLYELALEALSSRVEKQRDVHLVSSFGKEVWLNCRFAAFDSNGRPHLLLTINDMTERLRVEGEIQELNRNLQAQADSLLAVNKELEAFSYSVSHDLRAPLRAINGFIQILLDDYAAILDEEGKRVCLVVRDEARRMGDLIDNLLAISRVGRVEMRRSAIDMGAMVESVFGVLTKPEERERIDFRVAPLAPARGDETLIRQVWMNLLSNAIKFSSKRERAVIEVGCARNDREMEYFVRDNGAGFDMSYAGKLFGVFQRLHNEGDFEGTGVGLAIVHRAVIRHGGRVWAESAKDQGAVFYFTLPETGGR